jgi:zinc transport system substrate-binding protein
MNIHDPNIATPKVTTGPLPASRKVYAKPEAAPDLRVPVREIALDDAVGSAGGTVYDGSRPLTPLLPADQRDDPHVWLSPQTMELIAHEASVALSHADSGYAKDYAEQETNVVGPELTKLTQEYDRGLKTCEFRSFVDTHEAFGMLAHYENLRQIGIEGLTPESEPSADRLKVAEDAIAAGTAAPAIFYEPTDEGKRIGESVAADADVRALPLDPLEAAPPSGDLLSVFRANLATLKDGLSCQS